MYLTLPGSLAFTKASLLLPAFTTERLLYSFLSKIVEGIIPMLFHVASKAIFG